MPLNRNQKSSYQRERASELFKMATLLDRIVDSDKRPVVRDAGPLNAAAIECQNFKGDHWAYTLSALEFIEVPGEALRHVRPEEAEITSIDLSMEMKGIYCAVDEQTDPFRCLEVGIFVRGRARIPTPTNPTNTKSVSCAWHFDRQQESSDGGIPSAAHPAYHFQHGGRKMWGLDNADYGAQLLLEAPRIAHPPLDAILAVDFILSNYYGTLWLDLSTNDTQYRQLIGNAQHRCWRAYSIATASIWQRAQIDRSWEAVKIWPQLSYST